jgi:Arc/MetJ-type ribon-helix-helix transcriptional regulator
MPDSLVSIRLPKSLAEELNLLVKRDHYMDASEAIRSILREQFERYSDPYAYELKELRDSITKEMKEQIARKSEQRIVDELKKMKERIRNDFE